MPRTLNYRHEPDEQTLEDRAARTTAWTIGLSLFPLALWVVADFVVDIDTEPASTVVGVITCVVWLAALVNGIVGVVRCRAWKQSGTNNVATADSLMLINAFPAGMVVMLALIAGVVWLGWNPGVKANPKLEARNPKQGPKLKEESTETQRDVPPVSRFLLRSFGFVSDFVLRISDFHRPCAPQLSAVPSPPFLLTMHSILHSFAYALDYLREQLADVRAADMAAQPKGITNHPAWVVGHLAHSCELLCEVVGVSPWLPADRAARYGTGSVPVADVNEYPPKEEALAILRDAQARLTRAVERLEPAALDAPFPDPSYRDVFPTVRHALTQVMVGHTSMHVGQLTVWRRAMGLPPMRRSFE